MWFNFGIQHYVMCYSLHVELEEVYSERLLDMHCKMGSTFYETTQGTNHKYIDVDSKNKKHYCVWSHSNSCGYIVKDSKMCIFTSDTEIPGHVRLSTRTLQYLIIPLLSLSLLTVGRSSSSIWHPKMYKLYNVQQFTLSQKVWLVCQIHYTLHIVFSLLFCLNPGENPPLCFQLAVETITLDLTLLGLDWKYVCT